MKKQFMLINIWRVLVCTGILWLFIVSSSFAAGPMKMAYGWSTKTNEGEAVKEDLTMMQKVLGVNNPKLVTIFSTGAKYNQNEVFQALRNRLKPEVRIWGLNSDIAGIAVPNGVHSGLSIMGFYSPGLVVGVGTAKLDWKNLGSYKKVGESAIQEAYKNAHKTKREPPKVIFFAGLNLITDIDIFQGVEDAVGQTTPIWGGNAGQSSGESKPGDGQCFSNNGVDGNCVSVAALWMDSKVGVAYGYGYNENPKCSGIVTKADINKRLIFTINDRPAADVYNEWTGGKITNIIKAGGGLNPLAVQGRYGFKKPIKEGISDYVLVGITSINPDKSVFMTHEGVEERTKITLTEFASEREFVQKPAVIATIARNRGAIPKENVAGALFLYCYAQYYVAKEYKYDIKPTFALLSKSLMEKPFTGFFAGGEIGYSPQGKNRMMAWSTVIIVFGKN